ncbi:MAG: electron transporter RnfC, partial [Candidatus Omnitrophica bacterium]|nr:electron transporter RnfC [Candidatus Omnitrophota bacterium]
MIKIEEYKEPQHNLLSEKFLDSSKLYLPLAQHTGAPSLLCVKKGDEVNEGDTIAKSNGMISAQIHAPKKGKIIDIVNWYHPILKKSPAIILQCQDEEKDYPLKENKDIASLTKENILEIIANYGIVGMGGAAFPTHVKLNPPKQIDTLIINGCECEPYLACDYRLMVENMEEILKGIKLICRLINPKEIIFAIEENKPEAIKKINFL